jgi:type 2 lantibiotic biosynthesis protein LanM
MTMPNTAVEPSLDSDDTRFFHRLAIRAATIDELLSDGFEALRGEKRDTDKAAQHLASWCRSCASGDWALFGRRLARDNLTFDQVLPRLASARYKASADLPGWIEDARWIEAALRPTSAGVIAPFKGVESYAFEQLLWPLVKQADVLLGAAVDPRAFANLAKSARDCFILMLLRDLSGLCAPAFYERFSQARKMGHPPSQAREAGNTTSVSSYEQFVVDMKSGGLRRLFKDKPVLLRLIATVVRQWIDSTGEFILRLNADLAAITHTVLQSTSTGPAVGIEGDHSDRHNGGRSVLLLTFENGSRVVYKPKDLRVDHAWHALVSRLSGMPGSPIELKSARTLACDGYGWTEFIDHTGCVDQSAFRRFFRRAGAWLALFHCFAATDMHQENIIASDEHPVPIDLEMLLQASVMDVVQDPEEQAAQAATEVLARSVMSVGLLPAYGRAPNNSVFAMGGMTSGWNAKSTLGWNDINSDTMRPVVIKRSGTSNPNLPHVDGRYAKFVEHVEDFIVGFSEYAKFLRHLSRDADHGQLFQDFVGLPVRKVIRPTRFYHMLLQRLKNHHTMTDGIIWSAQADFLARLTNWEIDDDPLWRFQRLERDAVLQLDVPHFVDADDRGERAQTADRVWSGVKSLSGLDVARARLDRLDDKEIAWQTEIIRQNISTQFTIPEATPAERQQNPSFLGQVSAQQPATESFAVESDRLADELSRYAIRRGPSAAWIGLDFLGDAEVFQLACLRNDLYNGSSGIAVFLAAHALTRSNSDSAELALAAVAQLRKNLAGRNAARMARSLGVGGAVGLGSIVYALCVMSNCLNSSDLLSDALKAADLFTNELIAADTQLDVMGGSAGGILGLLRLYRDTESEDVLIRAIKCGEHVIDRPRLGPEGRRSWAGQGAGSLALNGMSHGAAGFAYALASLAIASGREEFGQAAAECIAFEDSSYDTERNNWPDFRNSAGPSWTCQWCHGAPGIGLARLATRRSAVVDGTLLDRDISNAIEGVRRCSSVELDTLCCGTLGSIEFFCEAGRSLNRADLREIAAQRLTAVLGEAAKNGDYRWNSGTRQFNLGLFRGLSGVGYTILRQINPSLPNILIWQ